MLLAGFGRLESGIYSGAYVFSNSHIRPIGGGGEVQKGNKTGVSMEAGVIGRTGSMYQILRGLILPLITRRHSRTENNHLLIATNLVGTFSMASIVFIPMLIFWGQLYLNMLPAFSPSVVVPITIRRLLVSNQNTIESSRIGVAQLPP